MTEQIRAGAAAVNGFLGRIMGPLLVAAILGGAAGWWETQDRLSAVESRLALAERDMERSNATDASRASHGERIAVLESRLTRIERQNDTILAYLRGISGGSE